LRKSIHASWTPQLGCSSSSSSAAQPVERPSAAHLTLPRAQQLTGGTRLLSRSPRRPSQIRARAWPRTAPSCVPRRTSRGPHAKAASVVLFMVPPPTVAPPFPLTLAATHTAAELPRTLVSPPLFPPVAASPPTRSGHGASHGDEEDLMPSVCTLVPCAARARSLEP
jgi:hypothetical protein